MTTETARILAHALMMHDQARKGMKRLIISMKEEIEPPAAKLAVLRDLAQTYVHEERVINRIVYEDEDGD